MWVGAWGVGGWEGTGQADGGWEGHKENPKLSAFSPMIFVPNGLAMDGRASDARPSQQMALATLGHGGP